MSGMTVEQAVWMRDFYLKPLKLESETTFKVLSAVTPDRPSTGPTRRRAPRSICCATSPPPTIASSRR